METLESGSPLDLVDLSKEFGERRVLNRVNLHLKPGEFVAIVGRSGCGKSTLLRLAAGLDSPTAGEARIGGHRLNGVDAAIRIMFQDARLLPWMRVGDNVAIGLRKERRDQAVRALEQVGLADRAGEWPHVLSGGQKQRVALARALAGTPGLLLLDEPLSALDALTRLEMQQLIECLWLQQRFTALLVTHDVEEAVTLADRIVVLEAGEIRHEVPVTLSRPRHRDDARFGVLEEEVLSHLLDQDFF